MSHKKGRKGQARRALLSFGRANKKQDHKPKIGNLPPLAILKKWGIK